MTEQEKDWLTVDVVQQQFDRAARYVADGAMADYQQFMQFDLRGGLVFKVVLESPLEAIFFLWWRATEHLSLFKDLRLETQWEVEASGERFRLDFVVVPMDWQLHKEFQARGIAWPQIGIEVDGHTFHEKTKEQVEYRNRRDRALQSEGWKIFHYSWSEVMRDPATVVAEVHLYGRDVLDRLLCELNVARQSGE